MSNENTESPSTTKADMATNDTGVVNTSAPAPIPFCSAWLACVDALKDSMLESLARWRGYSLEFCLYLKMRLLVGLFKGRIAFPITTQEGAIIGCHHRPLAAEGGWLVTPFAGPMVPLLPFAVNDPKTKATVFAFESQWDMLAFLDKAEWQKGDIPDYGFVATRGAMNTKRVANTCGTGSTVIAFGQNDKPGQKWLYRIASAFKGTVLQARIPNAHKDLNEWTQSGATWEQIENLFSNLESSTI